MGKIINKLSYIYYKFISKIYLFGVKKRGKNILFKRPIRIINKQYLTIGDNVSILDSLRLECIDEWNSKKYTPSINIGDNCNIEQNVHITSAGMLHIGNNVSILASSCITNINHEYENIELSPKYQDISVNDVIIGDNCFIGIHSCILPGTELGDHVVVGANSVVIGKFPSYCVIAGVPARIVKIYKDGEWVRYDYKAK